MVKKIRVYTTPICMECDRLKKFLKEKNVEFEEIDIFENTEKAKEIFEKTGQKRVPIIELNGEFFHGFNKDRILEEFEK